MTFGALLVTCEHAGNRVPDGWDEWFEGHDDLLASHRGWDPGALEVAEGLSVLLNAPLVTCMVTRLLADPNRSEGHPALHGPPLRRAPRDVRARALAAAWRPHRTAVERAVEQGVRASNAPVLHLSVHSFTPVLDGVARSTGVGLLYDPAREPERNLCAAWVSRLREEVEEPIHRNRPYRGTSDGLTVSLRRAFDASEYAGIEIEVRSDLIERDGARVWADRLAGTLAAARS